MSPRPQVYAPAGQAAAPGPSGAAVAAVVVGILFVASGALAAARAHRVEAARRPPRAPSRFRRYR